MILLLFANCHKTSSSNQEKLSILHQKHKYGIIEKIMQCYPRKFLQQQLPGKESSNDWAPESPQLQNELEIVSTPPILHSKADSSNLVKNEVQTANDLRKYIGSVQNAKARPRFLYQFMLRSEPKSRHILSERENRSCNEIIHGKEPTTTCVAMNYQP